MSLSVFRVWEPGGGGYEDSGKELEALDAEDAAILYAEWADWQSAEYLFAKHGGTVRVSDADGKEQSFTIHAETRPEYFASLDAEDK